MKCMLFLPAIVIYSHKSQLLCSICTTLPSKELSLHILCQEQYSRLLTTCSNISLTLPWPLLSLKFPDYSRFSRWVAIQFTKLRRLLICWMQYNTEWNVFHLDIVNKNFLEPIRTHVFCCFRRTIANVRHEILAFKSTSYTVINTLRLSPAWLSIQNTM